MLPIIGNFTALFIARTVQFNLMSLSFQFRKNELECVWKYKYTIVIG